MSRRRGILLAFLGIGIVVIGVLFVAAILRQSIAPLQVPTPLPPVTVPVVLTTHSISVRALLKEQDLALVDVPVELVPLEAVSELDAAVGKITKIPLAPGEMVMQHHLADPTNINKDLAFIIGDDMVVMAFPATDLMSQINILQAGDLVDILVSIEVPVLPSGETGVVGPSGEEQQSEAELFTFDALQRIEISAFVVEIVQGRTAGQSTTGTTRAADADATPQPTPTPAPSQVEPQAILLALAAQDALVLKHLKDAGGIVDIVLRAPTSAQIFELSPVMAEYLKDRFELVIER